MLDCVNQKVLADTECWIQEAGGDHWLQESMPNRQPCFLRKL